MHKSCVSASASYFSVKIVVLLCIGWCRAYGVSAADGILQPLPACKILHAGMQPAEPDLAYRQTGILVSNLG